MFWDVFMRSGKRFRCKKTDEGGVSFIKCDPIVKSKVGSKPLSESTIIFQLVEDPRRGKVVPDLIDDGGTDQKTIKELDDYLRHFVD